MFHEASISSDIGDYRGWLHSPQRRDRVKWSYQERYPGPFWLEFSRFQDLIQQESRPTDVVFTPAGCDNDGNQVP